MVRTTEPRGRQVIDSTGRLAARPDVPIVNVHRGPQAAVADALKIPVPMAAVGELSVKNTPLDELMSGLARYAMDPLGFVMWAFPWGEAGTPLEDMDGPEEWQRGQLTRIGERLMAGGVEGAVIEEDVTAGHGVGKSAQVSWMILWAISTHADTRGVVTANTDAQLRTKTWAELAKWFSLFIAKQLFTLTASSIYIAGDTVREKKWRIDQVPWSREKPENFAGLHNQGKRQIIIFDEASAIDDVIYEVAEGALTDAKTQVLWLRYGNPTRTSGRFFRNCSPGSNKRNVWTRVDSRQVRFTNKAQIQALVEEYGEDSDFIRVRVKGEFPRAGFSNFISPELVHQARRRRIGLTEYSSYQKILSVDPARFGDDSSVITLRQGRKVHFQLELKGYDGFDIASRLERIVREEHGIAVIVYDAIGNGAELDGVLKRCPWVRCTLMPIMWGKPASDTKQFFNQRAEAWSAMRTWLEHGVIPDDDDLANQLTSLDYGYDVQMRIQIQSKKDVRKNGGKSPDKADSLALSMLPDTINIKTTVAKVRPVQRRTVIWSR